MTRALIHLTRRALLVAAALGLALGVAFLASGSGAPSAVQAQPGPCDPDAPPEECPFPIPISPLLPPGGSSSSPIVTICSPDGSQCVTVELPGPNNPQPRLVAVVTPLPALVADLVINTAAFPSVVPPGGTLQYSVSVFNGGPNAVAGARVTDVFPASLAVNWVCSASPGSACPASGQGAIDTAVDLSVGGSVAFTATVTLVPGLIGQLSNTATVQPPAGVIDSNQANNSATATVTVSP